MKGGNETTYLSRSSARSRERMAQHGDLNHDLATDCGAISNASRSMT
jgi:hypothetical protein